MKAFSYNGRAYLRVIPGKSLFRSTLVHEVVNRGDIFALDLDSQQLTVLPGKAEVEHFDCHFMRMQEPQEAPASSAQSSKKAEAIAKLRKIRAELDSGSPDLASAVYAAAQKELSL